MNKHLLYIYIFSFKILSVSELCVSPLTSIRLHFSGSETDGPFLARRACFYFPSPCLMSVQSDEPDTPLDGSFGSPKAAGGSAKRPAASDAGGARTPKRQNTLQAQSLDFSKKNSPGGATGAADRERREEAGATATGTATEDEGDRCKRNDGKNWRCPEKVLPGHKHCPRHLRGGSPARVSTGKKSTQAPSSSEPSSPNSQQDKNDSPTGAKERAPGPTREPKQPKAEDVDFQSRDMKGERKPPRVKVVSENAASRRAERTAVGPLEAKGSVAAVTPVRGTERTPKAETSGKPFRGVKARWLSSFRLESSQKEELKKLVSSEMDAAKTVKPVSLSYEEADAGPVEDPQGDGVSTVKAPGKPDTLAEHVPDDVSVEEEANTTGGDGAGGPEKKGKETTAAAVDDEAERRISDAETPTEGGPEAAGGK